MQIPLFSFASETILFRITYNILLKINYTYNSRKTLIF